MKTLTLATMAGALLAVSVSAASANGLLEDRPWQFRTPQERSAAILQEDLRQRQDGGYYDQWNVDQDFNCEAGATCTNLGFGAVGTQNTAIGNQNNAEYNVSGEGNTVSGNETNPNQRNSDSNVGANSNRIGRDLVGGGNGVGQSLAQ